MSRLRDLYRLLATRLVSWSSPTLGQVVEPPTRDLDHLRNFESSAELPVRLLLPVSALEGTNTEFITYCNTMTATWRVTDLMLFRPLAQGMGLQDAAEDLVLYAAAYTAALPGLRYALRDDENTFDLTSTTMQPGVFEFPRGSGTRYLGVECALTFTETLEA